jgi:hypothetical protein
VKVGREPGVYTSWGDCREQVHRYPGALFKTFTTQEEAKSFTFPTAHALGVTRQPFKKGATKSATRHDSKASSEDVGPHTARVVRATAATCLCVSAYADIISARGSSWTVANDTSLLYMYLCGVGYIFKP